MPLYRYEALDRTGNKVVGAMQVADEHALASRLQTMGYQPLLVETSRRPLQYAPQAAAVGAGFPAAMPAAPLITSPLTASERSIARMFHQLYISFRAGMPAYQAVSTVAGQVHERPLRQALLEIAQGIQEGQTLSGLMERYPRLFTRGDLGMMRAAERGGFLPEAFGALAQQHEQDDNTRRRLKVWEWFLHLHVVVALIVIALAFFFAPGIAAMDARPGFRAVGNAFLAITLPGLVLYFGGLMCLERIRRSPRWAYRWHRFLLRLPAVGKINFLRSNAVFTRTLQYLYHSGTPAPTAWETAAGAVPNLYLAERHLEGKPVVDSTGRLTPAMQQVGLLAATDIGMIATGESTGEIPQALQYLANHYEEETRVALGASVVRGAVTYLIWTFLLGGIATVALAYGTYGQIFGAVEKFFGTGD